ncbi:hypothetical protein [Phenylobacterium sp.]|jgi:hypothetical protein|uniref:hypothetical protein n=1 Tax=Phenylobacterium sp. TaxID=1871053 RepID=UPI0037C6AFE1
MTTALISLMHVLVFVYWLGGDLGAFYTSRLVSDPARPVAARIAAAQALTALDMAPRTALILALPTSATLANATGHIVLPTEAIAAIWALSLAWLWLAWRIHLKHIPPGAAVRRLDLAIRWLMLAGLAGVGFGIVTSAISAPLFVGLKLLVLAAAIGTGLWVRRLISPFGPAFSTLVTTGPTPEVDQTITRSLARARPVVMLIWGLLLTAAFLGFWRPQ